MVRWFAAMVMTCLVTAPAAAETSRPVRQIGQPLSVEQLLMLEAQVPGSEPGSFSGTSVALSDDGMTAVVGAPVDNCEAGARCGAAQILVRSGETWIEQAQLTASDRTAGDAFGSSVTLSGDGSIALIGALEADCPTGPSRSPAHVDPPGPPFPRCGAAYMFVRSGQSWTQVQKLFAPDPSDRSSFSQSVALSRDGSVALVGSPAGAACIDQTGDCGTAYIFIRIGGSWIETARFDPLDPHGPEGFGSSVSLSDDGTVALIGAPFEDCPQGSACGNAYVFVGSGASWVRERRFTDSNPHPFNEFGFSVSLSSDGEVALVGEYSNGCAVGTQCAAAYVFARNGGQWTQSAKLTIPDLDEADFFGIQVDLAGDARHALISGPTLRDCQPGGDCRLAHLFVDDGGLWREKQRLTVTRACAVGPSPSVTLSENADRALVGVPYSGCPLDPGQAYIFGNLPSPLEVPVASGWGLAALTIALTAIGTAMLRR